MGQWEGIDEAVAVADSGSFVGAAALLKVSTSHVSRAIARLEDRLGSMLFYRTTRYVGLTDTGRSFVAQARRLIQERDELHAFASGDGEPQGELRVTSSIAMGERFVAPILARFADRYPRISIVLDLTNRVTDLVAEGYDIGIRTGDIADQRLASRKVALRKLETVAAPTYVARRGQPQSVNDLANHDCLAGTASNWMFLEKGAPRVIAPRARWRCNSGEVTVANALNGRGICQLPAFYVRTRIEEGHLVRVLPQCQAAPEPIWMVYARHRHLLPKIRKLGQNLEDQLQTALDQA